MSIKIALAGNQNSGKTTLFNLLTGINQKVGNWPGVTIERKEGRIKGTNLTIVDFDQIDETNINRQLVANSENIGKLKVDEMAKNYYKLTQIYK